MGSRPCAWAKDRGLRSFNTTLDFFPKVGAAGRCSSSGGTRRAEANNVRQSTTEPQTQEMSRIVMQPEQHPLCLACWKIVIGCEANRCVRIGHDTSQTWTLEGKAERNPKFEVRTHCDFRGSVAQPFSRISDFGFQGCRVCSPCNRPDIAAALSSLVQARHFLSQFAPGQVFWVTPHEYPRDASR